MIRSNEIPSSTQRIQDLSESRVAFAFHANLAVPSGRGWISRAAVSQTGNGPVAPWLFPFFSSSRLMSLYRWSPTIFLIKWSNADPSRYAYVSSPLYRPQRPFCFPASFLFFFYIQYVQGVFGDDLPATFNFRWSNSTGNLQSSNVSLKCPFSS